MADDFRPRSKFPLDPFAAIPHSAREPWIMNAERLSSPSGRDVLLVIGPSSVKDLEPLLYSPQLSNSLLILITHGPLPIPAELPIRPAVRVLRLTTPLALESAGSVRFVYVLEWAERVARVWRRRGDHDVLELTEDSTMSDLGPVKSRPNMLSTLTWSQPPSPRASATSLLPSTPPTLSRPSSPRPQVLEKRRDSRLPPVDPSQRAFDGLVNFLPSNLTDKVLLKYTILVTTISHTFLVAAVPISMHSRPSAVRRRSFLVRPNSVHTLSSRRSSEYTTNTSPSPSLLDFPSSTTAPTNAHLVHILPSRKPAQLLQSMETFLLSFCYPPTHYPHPRPPEQRTSPYLMAARTFAEAVPIAGTTAEPTVAEAVLSGALDLENSTNGEWRIPPRAWMAGPIDIILSSADQLRTLPVAPSPPLESLSLPAMSRTTHSDPNFMSVSLSEEGYSSADSTPLSTPRSDLAPVYSESGLRRGSELPTPPDSEEDVVVAKSKKSRGWRFWRGITVSAQ
ncbi:hypothetical protein NEOLEDRAFT_1179929 [Neolentinus lepideus HHB14362 ss-1]|uniref:Uncharacterized protein n=1 Tax=Neolentinus lepideus HHB14362 ss-1 TaxID=1314782 RepID=A0A165REX1_9AGAM|nr:hypothetical protein NEOLEDRAFT_1179929 [Neolentinus lepideus HHB14362 ss-1]